MSDYFVTREGRFIDNGLKEVSNQGRRGQPEELATHLVSTGYDLGKMVIKSWHDRNDIGWCYGFEIIDLGGTKHSFDLTYSAYERIQSAFFKKRESNMDKKFALSENGNVYDFDLRWVDKPGKGLGDVVGLLKRCVERGLHVHYFSREHGQEPHWSTSALYGAMVEHIPFTLSRDDYAELRKMTGALMCLPHSPKGVSTFVDTYGRVFDMDLRLATNLDGPLGKVLDLAKFWLLKTPEKVFVQSIPGSSEGATYYFGVEDVQSVGGRVMFQIGKERHEEIRKLLHNDRPAAVKQGSKDASVGDMVLYIFRHRGELVKRPAIVIAVRDLRADLHVFFKPDDRQESYIEGIVEGTKEFHWCRRE